MKHRRIELDLGPRGGAKLKQRPRREVGSNQQTSDSLQARGRGIVRALGVGPRELLDIAECLELLRVHLWNDRAQLARSR